MLASIHPLGERARGQRFGVTAIAYTLGSLLGAAIFGGALAWVGRLLFDTTSDAGNAVAVRAGVLATGALTAFVLDRRHRRIVSWHRQVNEDWLAEYRGWIYGFGFGLQLGLGVVTIVTTASVYLTWLAAFLVANPLLGVAIGAAFGLARAIPVIVGTTSRTPEAVAARVRSLDAWDGRFRIVTQLAEATVAVVAIALVMSA